jgi:hypothetical protein
MTLPSRFSKNASHASHASHETRAEIAGGKVSENASHASHASPDQVLEQDPWVVVDSELLGEKVAIVFGPENLGKARKAIKGITFYFAPEIEELYQLKQDSPNDIDFFLRLVHKAKKEFAGWVVPRLTGYNKLVCGI